jgi:hypothetical protein
MVNLGPGGGDIDGHQISYIRRDGGARFRPKRNSIGSAESRRRREPVVSKACD